MPSERSWSQAACPDAKRLQEFGNGRAFAVETDVTDLAALWSIDPSELEDQGCPAGGGCGALAGEFEAMTGKR